LPVNYLNNSNTIIIFMEHEQCSVPLWGYHTCIISEFSSESLYILVLNILEYFVIGGLDLLNGLNLSVFNHESIQILALCVIPINVSR
jgi:hypothetical protein